MPPSIKGGNITTEVTALLDTVVTLECEARGVPLPTITWYRNGEAILSNRQAQYVERGHYLKIPRAQASDAGQYTCKVTSVAGTAEKAYELDVYCKDLSEQSHVKAEVKSWQLAKWHSPDIYCLDPLLNCCVDKDTFTKRAGIIPTCAISIKLIYVMKKRGKDSF